MEVQPAMTYWDINLLVWLFRLALEGFFEVLERELLVLELLLLLVDVDEDVRISL